MNRSASLLGVSLILCGCGGGDDAKVETAPVKGVVLKDGKGVPNITVTFYPKEGGPVATGKTDEDGEFTLMTNQLEGAKVGEHEVALTFTPEETPPMPGTPEAENYKAPPSPIPARYGDPKQSRLTATVKKGEDNKPELKVE